MNALLDTFRWLGQGQRLIGIVLGGLFVISALGVVGASHETRNMYRELQALQKKQDDLESSFSGLCAVLPAGALSCSVMLLFWRGLEPGICLLRTSEGAPGRTSYWQRGRPPKGVHKGVHMVQIHMLLIDTIALAGAVTFPIERRIFGLVERLERRDTAERSSTRKSLAVCVVVAPATSLHALPSD